MDTARAAQEQVEEQRRSLPDAPGVYLFRDERGRVIYVGKARSLRKRVNSHFSRRGRGTRSLADAVAEIEFLVTDTEAEALLAEQRFIKLHRPIYNVRLRDDKSYPFIAISLDEEFPRVYFTRERHRPGRIYFGPFSNARKVRETLDLLGRIFQFRTCEGERPGRASGSPCLDYHIERCQAPCVGYVSAAEYRRSIEAIIDFLSGRYRAVERELEEEMQRAAARQEFERAARLRDRLQAVRALLERQRIANAAVGDVDVVAVAVSGTDANAQIFRVRDGVLADRQSFYLDNPAQRTAPEVAEEFLLQYYEGALSVPPEVVVQAGVASIGEIAEALARKRGARVEVRVAERGDKRRILELALRNAELALSQDRLRAQRRRSHRIETLERLRSALRLERLPMRIEAVDISNLMHAHTVAALVVFEGALPKKAHYRRFAVREVVQDDFAAIAQVLRRRVEERRRQLALSPHDPERDPSFAATPDLILIDGGRGQLSAGLTELDELRAAGVAVCALAKRLEEIYLPGAEEPIRLDRSSPELQLLQRIRDEAHRFALDYHRRRRTRDLRRSLLDELPGIGPARKRAILRHFGSPERVLEATREELEAVPGLPPKIARRIHEQLHKVR
ncbi:excinuclease ABC subunit UvrC [Thermoleophilum album]|uniref:UvrABC system protein C n=1 Tax=Thermoleophilum album TaxID=29539 RepID=A0A1H6FH59_THEAL|nr:excinuclease ABC subunit UvrC [Thermoleophilum album]SEH10189.1 Excinuclease ABC subunit C [Thermoleophilum album]